MFEDYEFDDQDDNDFDGQEDVELEDDGCPYCLRGCNYCLMLDY